MSDLSSADMLEALGRTALSVIAVDGKGRVKYFNTAARGLFGSLDGVSLQDPPPCDDPRGPLSHLLELWESGRSGADPEASALQRVKLDGVSVFLWSQTRPLGAPRSAGRLFLFLDLTKYMTGSEVVRRLVAQLAHDLRSPLTSIAGATELLLSGRVGELAGVQHKLVRIVDEGAGKMTHIIDKVADEGREGGEVP